MGDTDIRYSSKLARASKRAINQSSLTFYSKQNHQRYDCFNMLRRKGKQHFPHICLPMIDNFAHYEVLRYSFKEQVTVIIDICSTELIGYSAASSLQPDQLLVSLMWTYVFLCLLVSLSTLVPLLSTSAT